MSPVRHKPGCFSEKQIKDRLSISTYVYKQFRPLCSKTFEELADFGFRRIEIFESPEQFEFSSKKSMGYIFEECKNAGLEVCAFHAADVSFQELDTSEKRDREVDRCKRQIDVMLEGGAGIWGSHAKEITFAVEYCLEELLEHTEGTGAVIVLENFARPLESVFDRVKFIERINHPNLGLLLDIGHVRNSELKNPMTIPGGPSEVLDMCGKHLRFMHLHGFVDKDHYPPLGEGDLIQWVELFDKLYDTGYEGFFNFEPKGEAFHSRSLELTSEAPSRIAKMRR